MSCIDTTLLYFLCILQSNTFSHACYIFYRLSLVTPCPCDLQQLSSYLLQNLGGSRHSSVLTWFQPPHFRGSTPALFSRTFVTLPFLPEPSLQCFISQIWASNSFQTKDSAEQIMCWQQQHAQAGLSFPCFIYCCTSQIYWLRTPKNCRWQWFCQGTVTYGEVCTSKLSP